MTGSPNDIGSDEFFSADRVDGRQSTIELPEGSYLQYRYDLDDPTVARWRGQDYREFAAARTEPDFVQALLADWEALYREPFIGVTSDGTTLKGLYHLDDEVPPDQESIDAVRTLLAAVSDEERDALRHDMDAPEWRAWSNPEFVIHRVGLRLEDLDEAVVVAILAVVQASLSPEGYARVREAMGLNGFLGDLVGLPAIMNDRSYWFSLFGDPLAGEPWGWQLFGHHVAVNVAFVGGRQVVAPVFIGAEPALSDGERPALFDAREELALALASSLTDEQASKAVVYASVLDPSMPAERLHPADERHVAGAFRDNRVIPYEGIRATDLDEAQRALLRAIVADFHALLPTEQREATLRDFDAHVDDTWFAWYGSTDGTQPFYFRIQGPVIVAELDHHAGVWLSNRLPARFHVHTTLRLPNGNDYGRAYLAEWRTAQKA